MSSSTGTNGSYRYTDEDKMEMARLYTEERLTLNQVASRMGCDKVNVWYHLKRMGVPRRGTHSYDLPTGESHHWWKGGRSAHRGHVIIYKPDHPGSWKNGQIFEHRYLMEMHLRENHPDHPALLPGGGISRDWSVHHKNGQKGDNRIENLELLENCDHTPSLHWKNEIDRLRALLDSHGIPY